MENKNVKYCQYCGKVALVLTGPEHFIGPGCGIFPREAKNAPTTENYYKFIAVKYCRECSERQRAAYNSYRQQKHRRKNSYEKRILKREINQQKKQIKFRDNLLDRYIEENQELQQEVSELRLQLEAQRAAAYQQGREDTRRSLTGRVLEGLGNRLTGKT